jgi:hypothetical protein
VLRKRLIAIGVLLAASFSLFAESRADEPVTIIRPIILPPTPNGGPGCGGQTCWSVRYPEGKGSWPGQNQNSLDNSFVNFGNWTIQNTFKVYTHDQVNAKLDALKKDFEEREEKLEQRLKAEIAVQVDAIISARFKKP